MLNYLKCYDAGLAKIRLGRKKDGGYVILDGFQYDVFISGGIGRDDSFEIDFLKKHPNLQKKTYIYDGTVDKTPSPSLMRNFYKKNIGSSNSDSLTNLKDIINKHENAFVKMDIEGGERNWLDSMEPNELCKISQLAIEFHAIDNIDHWKYLYQLGQTHFIVHAHGNNYAKTFFYNGQNVPKFIELTYVRKTNIPNAKLNTQQFPIKNLDFPCDSDNHNDITLKGYPYSSESSVRMF